MSPLSEPETTSVTPCQFHGISTNTFVLQLEGYPYPAVAYIIAWYRFCTGGGLTPTSQISGYFEIEKCLASDLSFWKFCFARLFWLKLTFEGWNEIILFPWGQSSREFSLNRVLQAVWAKQVESLCSQSDLISENVMLLSIRFGSQKFSVIVN